MQNLNIARYGVTDRLKGHWKLFRQLWRAFVRIARHVLNAHGLVAIEWPHRCKYWRDSRVAKFLRDNGFSTALVAACMYGRRPQREHQADEYIGKIWRVSCSDRVRYCSALRRHAPPRTGVRIRDRRHGIVS